MALANMEYAKAFILEPTKLDRCVMIAVGYKTRLRGRKKEARDTCGMSEVSHKRLNMYSMGREMSCQTSMIDPVANAPGTDSMTTCNQNPLNGVSADRCNQLLAG